MAFGPCARAFGHPFVGFGGVALVLTIMWGSSNVSESQVCQTDEPTSCSDIVDGPSTEFMQQRDGAWLATSINNSRVPAENRPEYKFAYFRCSDVTGTALMHAGMPVNQGLCQALGCNYKQCLKKRWKCNRDTLMTDGDAEVECVAAKLNTNLNPVKFTAVFFCVIISGLMCVVGCFVGCATPPEAAANRGVVMT